MMARAKVYTRGHWCYSVDLQAQTKSSQSRTANIVVAYGTVSGKNLG
jgi:hypothetical protein